MTVDGLVEGRRYVVEWSDLKREPRSLAGVFRGRSGRYLLFAPALNGRQLVRVFAAAVSWAWEPPGWLFEARVERDRAAGLVGPHYRGTFRHANAIYRAGLRAHARRIGVELPAGDKWHEGVAEWERALALSASEK